MTVFRKQAATVPALGLPALIVILSGFLLCGVLKAQDRPANSPTGVPPASARSSLLTQVPPKLFPEFKARDATSRTTAAAASTCHGF